MIRHILVPATGTTMDDGVFSTALAVGRRDGAHLQFLHARVDVVEVLVGMSSDGMVGGAAVQGLIDQLETDAKTLEARARGAVAAFCTRSASPWMAPPPASPGPRPSLPWKPVAWAAGSRSMAASPTSSSPAGAAGIIPARMRWRMRSWAAAGRC